MDEWLRVGDDGDVKRAVAGPGEVIAIPARREHTIRNESDHEARALVVLAPAGAMEGFARAAAGLASGGAPSPAAVIALAEAHGIETTRPAPPSLASVTRRWATLLRTRRRDGSWADTPVNMVADGGRAYFGTAATTAKVRRLRARSEVEIAPCTVRGRPTGPAVPTRARLLEGEEARRAARLLTARHPVVRRLLVPLELRLKRTRELRYEITAAVPPS